MNRKQKIAIVLWTLSLITWGIYIKESLNLFLDTIILVTTILTVLFGTYYWTIGCIENEH